MLTNQKNEILTFIERSAVTAGSQAAVANKTGASAATISHMLTRKWDKISDEMWRQVGAALGWKSNGWQLVETNTTKFMAQTYEVAKQQSRWLCVTGRAGLGKSASARAYQLANAGRAVYLLSATELSPRAFMEELCRVLGLRVTRKDSARSLCARVVKFFKDRADDKPLLVIDEGDKLTHGAMRLLIPLYNALEDEIGLVMQATKNLKRQFDTGAQWHKKGIEEVRSRFGDGYIHPPGNTREDVEAICRANGLVDDAAIEVVWTSIDKEHESVELPGGRRRRMVRVTATRKLKNLIQTQLFIINQPLAHAS